MFRDYKVYIVPVEFDQDIRQWYDQDDCRRIGHRRVATDYKVLCRSEELAKARALDAFRFNNIQITGPVRCDYIDAFVIDHWCNSGDREVTPVGPEVLNRKVKEV